jgi:hypothetical protein
MNIHKLATSRSVFVILLLIVAMLMSSIAFCQTATKQFPKITTAQVPTEPGSKEDQELINLLVEQNRRLKEENARLKAEIETLKQNK